MSLVARSAFLPSGSFTSSPSKYMVDGRLIPKALGWAQVKDSFAQVASLDKAAYDKTGQVPPAANFADKNAKDLRGAPIWDMRSWASASDAQCARRPFLRGAT